MSTMKSFSSKGICALIKAIFTIATCVYLTCLGCDSQPHGHYSGDTSAVVNDSPISLHKHPEQDNDLLLIELKPHSADAHNTEIKFYGQISMVSLEFSELENNGGSKFEIFFRGRKLLIDRDDIVSIDGMPVHDNGTSTPESD